MIRPHPAWIYIISPMVSSIALLVIMSIPNLYAFSFSVGLWMIFFIALHHSQHVPRHQTALSIMTAVSFVILLILIESIYLRWFFVGFAVPVFFFIVYWSQPRLEQAVHIKEKPLRRIMMMLYVFNVYALLLGLFAVYLFFPSVPFWVLSFVGGLYSALGSYMIWNLYFKVAFQDMLVWSMIVCISVIEYMWVMRLLPFGYLVLGLLTVWVWYLIQLFIRFHLSTKGILWKEQRGFILGNVVLYVVVLYLIRWI